MAEKVVWIDVDKLGIDAVNVRGGEWKLDEEAKQFVDDIKNNGIIDPLLVRPAEGDKYAIVCGSRRYNASIEAGLTKVRCFIEEMDDVTAMGRSIAENKYSEDIPAWRYALRIGEMFEKLNHTGKKEEVIKIIMAKTGFSRTSVQNYLDIFGLPSEIFELMKESTERSEVVKELLKKMPMIGTKTLTVEKAVKIAKELSGFSVEKMFEVATYIIPLTRETAFELIEKIKVYPKASMEKIHDMVSAIPKGARWMFEFGSHIVSALDEACIRKNMDRKTLVVHYVEDGLRRNGFL